jgi:hypothetical protein
MRFVVTGSRAYDAANKADAALKARADGFIITQISEDSSQLEEPAAATRAPARRDSAPAAPGLAEITGTARRLRLFSALATICGWIALAAAVAVGAVRWMESNTTDPWGVLANLRWALALAGVALALLTAATVLRMLAALGMAHRDLLRRSTGQQ